MARLVTALFFALLAYFATGAYAEEGTALGTSFGIGPSGVTFGAPGLERGIGIKNDGNGVYSMSFSLSGTAARAIGDNGGPARVLPPIRIGPSSGVLTDPATFFRGVGADQRREERAPGRRPRAVGSER